MKQLFTPYGIDHLVIACKNRWVAHTLFKVLGFEVVHAPTNDHVEYDEYFGCALQREGTRIFLVDPKTKRFPKGYVSEFIQKYGVMQVMEVSIRVNSIRGVSQELMQVVTTRNYGEDSFGICTTSDFKFSYRHAFEYTFTQRSETFSSNIDHIAVALEKNEIDWQVANYKQHGFQIVYAPQKRKGFVQGTYSAMRTYALRRGGWTVALVEGVDQEEVSQITTYVNLHGNHSVHHTALYTPDLEKTITSYLAAGIGFRLHKIPSAGEEITTQHIIHNSIDATGKFRQCFTKPFSRRRGKGGFFFELIERLHDDSSFGEESFDDRTVGSLHESIEREIKAGDKSLILSS